MIGDNENPVGHYLADLPTPCLVVDGEILDQNLDQIALVVAKAGLSLRPHVKAHKSPEIALRQIERGAIGVCCQTVREVEAFAENGVGNILLTNQIAHKNSAIRLAHIAKNITVGVTIDHPFQVAILNEAALDHKRKIDIYVEIEVGGQRCGVVSVDEAVSLIRLVEESPHLIFAGLQAYNGKTQHIYDAEARKEEVKTTAQKTLEFSSVIKTRGINIPVITGGGTGSLEQDISDGVLTELQCGSYALMDADYQSLDFNSPTADFRFGNALAVAARVISKRGDDYSVINAGLKAFSFDSGEPVVQSHPGLVYINPSDEHGIICSKDGSALPEIGEVILLTPGHCDPTVALYGAMHIRQKNQIKERWPVVARGEW